MGRIDPIMIGIKAQIIANSDIRIACPDPTTGIVGRRGHHKDQTSRLLGCLLVLEEEIDDWDIAEDGNLVVIILFDLSIESSHQE